MSKYSGGKFSIRKMVIVLVIGMCTCVMPLSCFATEEIAKWRIEAGPSYRGNMETVVKGGSRARSAFIKATQPAQSIPPKAKGEMMDLSNPDDISQTGDRDFDDGFVYKDAYTDSENWIPPFHTVNFGYQNNSQNDAAAGVLTFHRENDVSDSVFLGKGTEYRKTVRTNNDEVINTDQNFGAGGLKVDTLYDLASRGGVNIALAAGLRGFFGMDSSVRVSNFSQTITESRTSYQDYYVYSGTTNDTYTFLHGGSIPQAPYSNPDGNPFADPLISNIPDSATRDINVNDVTRRDYLGRQITRWETANQIEIDTDVDLFQLAMGGEIRYEIATAVAFILRPLLLVNLINVDAMRNEELVSHYPSGDMMSLGSWQDKESDNSVRIGAAIEAGVNVKLSESWFAGITAGYEWIDNTSVTVGPNEINIDLSGFTTSFIIGVRF